MVICFYLGWIIECLVCLLWVFPVAWFCVRFGRVLCLDIVWAGPVSCVIGRMKNAYIGNIFEFIWHMWVLKAFEWRLGILLECVLDEFFIQGWGKMCGIYWLFVPCVLQWVGGIYLDILVLDGACVVLFYFWFWLILSFLPVVR